MKTYKTHSQLKLDIEKLLKKAIRKEFKLNEYLRGFSFDAISTQSIKIADCRNGADKENCKELKIKILRKSNGTHAYIKSESPNQKQPNFEYKFPARHIDLEYKNRPYERDIKDAFVVNELKLSLMIKSLMHWIKRELE